MFKSILFYSILLVIAIPSFGQTSIDLDSPESVIQYHCMNTNVRLIQGTLPGYNFSPTGIEGMHSYTSNLCVATTPETPQGLGSLELTPDFGTPPYYYDWDDGDQSQRRYNLDSRVYSITVTDNLSVSQNVVAVVGVEPEWVNPTGVSTLQNRLRKDAANGWGNGMVSLNNNTDGEGEIRVTIEEVSYNTEWTYGFRLSTNSQATQYAGLDYGFYIDATNKLFVYENSTLTQYGTVAVGDVISIEKTATTFVFKKNDGTPLYTTSTFPPANTYVLDLSMYTSGTFFYHVIPVNFPYWTKPIETITHNPCSQNSANGAINLAVIGPEATSYDWDGPNGFTATTQNISALTVGDYTVNIDYGGVSNVVRTYNVGYEINWWKRTMATATGSALDDIGSSGYGNSGASSTNILTNGQDGWVEFSVTLNSTTENNLAVGLSAIDNDNKNLIDIDYGLEFFSVYVSSLGIYSRNVQVIEAGVRVGYPSFFSPSDKFKIVFDNTTGQISYYKNGTYLPPMLWPIPPPTPWPGPYFSTVPVNNYELDVPLAENGEGISVANASFDCISSYPTLKKKLDAGFYIAVAERLKFQYLEEYSVASSNLDVSIYKSDLSPIASIPVNTISKMGANYYEIDLSTLTGFVTGKFYVLEVTNDKNEISKLRFLYK